jgi:sugar/nucleoside kinase (ribokinase family)
LLAAHLCDPRVEHHLGGNVLNVVTYLAATGIYREVAFASVHGGYGNMQSAAIIGELKRFGITDLSPVVGGYEPSISIVERKGDRMTRGRSRDSMRAHLTPERIADMGAGADVVAISSLKDAKLLHDVLTTVPEGVFVSVNPGSGEIKDQGDQVIRSLSTRQPDLLTLNDEELRKLFMDNDTPLPGLVQRANGRLATHILCTAGSDGAYWGYNGDVAHGQLAEYGADVIPYHQVEDTLGAGDRAHGEALHVLAHGGTPEQALERAVVGPLAVIQVVGAHGDLQPYIPS